MPQRITRSRKRGSKMPAGSIYVGRPTLWGNPFTADRFGHAKCVILHKAWLAGRIGDLLLENLGFCPSEIEALHRKRERTLDRMAELKGHDLACWCPRSTPWCHADYLLNLSN